MSKQAIPKIRQAILRVLEDGRPHSVADITKRTGSSDPRAHIRHVRKAGIPIADYWSKTAEGGRFKYYFLQHGPGPTI